MRPGIRLLSAPEANQYTATATQFERLQFIETLDPSQLCAVCAQLASGHLILSGARAGGRSYRYDPPVLLSVCTECLKENQPAIHQLVKYYFPFAVGIRISY